MNILYIGNKIEKPQSGGDQINYRNQKLLELIQGRSLDFIEIDGGSTFAKFYLGATDGVLQKINKALKTGNYTHVFISQSLLGRAARFIKKQYPDIIIHVFYHNIESQYAHEYYKTTGIKALPFYLLTKRYEALAAKYGDKHITLNSRDAELLKATYSTKSDLSLPTSLEDRFDEAKMLAQANQENDEPIFLFVGVAFFANTEAVQWFIDNVMPFVRGTFYVVGKGMDSVPFRGITDKVKVFGFVDDLSEFYYKADYVVSPILSGGGMKTKTAEALMYGKTILGTTEAFEGYEVDDRCMLLCDTKESFIEVINNKLNYNKQNLYARELFSRLYNYEKTLLKYKGCFE